MYERKLVQNMGNDSKRIWSFVNKKIGNEKKAVNDIKKNCN